MFSPFLSYYLYLIFIFAITFTIGTLTKGTKDVFTECALHWDDFAHSLLYVRDIRYLIMRSVLTVIALCASVGGHGAVTGVVFPLLDTNAHVGTGVLLTSGAGTCIQPSPQPHPDTHRNTHTQTHTHRQTQTNTELGLIQYQPTEGLNIISRWLHWT